MLRFLTQGDSLDLDHDGGIGLDHVPLGAEVGVLEARQLLRPLGLLALPTEQEQLMMMMRRSKSIRTAE
jgi:hypothetical protein